MGEGFWNLKEDQKKTTWACQSGLCKFKWYTWEKFNSKTIHKYTKTLQTTYMRRWSTLKATTPKSCISPRSDVAKREYTNVLGWLWQMTTNKLKQQNLLSPCSRWETPKMIVSAKLPLKALGKNPLPFSFWWWWKSWTSLVCGIINLCLHKFFFQYTLYIPLVFKLNFSL